MSKASSSKMATKGSPKKKGKKKGGKSGLNAPVADTLLWNISSQSAPFMRNLTVKDNKPYKIIQTRPLGNQMGSLSSSSAVYSKNVTTGDVNQYSSFAAIFDQYRFVQIELWAEPFGPGASSTYINSTGARVYSVTDFDDSNNLTSGTQATQYQNVTVSNLNEGIYRSCRPHIAVAAYGGAFTQFKNEVSDWIDVASTGVQHYGFKFLTDPTAANNDVVFNFFVRVHIEFRNLI